MSIAPPAGKSVLLRDRGQVARAFVLVAALWALVLRTAPLAVQIITSGHVQDYHSGGLFWAFVEAIKANQYRLPAIIPNYTAEGLPFAYPPLAFYLVAVVSDLFETGPATILVLNALLSFLSVLALLKVLAFLPVPAPGKAAALLAFATLPQLFGEQLGGEGLAEALGMLCLVLFLAELLRLENSWSWPGSVRLGLLLGFNVLASPGTAYAAPVSTLIYFILSGSGRDAAFRRNLIRCFAITVAIALAVASPYLLHVTKEYGAQLLFGAFRGQQFSSAVDLIRGMQNTLLSRSFAIPAWNICALIGLVYCFVKGDYFWIVWPLFMAVIPREGMWLVGLPIAILAGVGFSQVLLPSIFKSELFAGVSHRWPFGNGGLALVLLGAYAAVFAPVSAFLVDQHASNKFDVEGYVTPGEASYLRELRRDTDPGLRILMVGNENEWSPLLSERPVLNVIFGTEWIPARAKAIREMNELITSSRNADQLLDSIEYMERKFPSVFPRPDLLYFSKYDAYPRGNPKVSAELLESLRTSPRVIAQVDNADVAAYRLAGAGR